MSKKPKSGESRADAMIWRAIAVDAFKERVVQELIRYLDRLKRKVDGVIKDLWEREPDSSTKARELLEKKSHEIGQAMIGTYAEMAQIAENRKQELVTSELQYIHDEVLEGRGVVPTPADVYKSVRAKPFEGWIGTPGSTKLPGVQYVSHSPLRNVPRAHMRYMDKLLNRAMREGWYNWRLEEHLEQINGFMKEIDEGFDIARRNIKTEVRTSLQVHATRAHQMVWEANKDLFPYVQFVAVLDGRTTKVCASLDGTVWEVDDPNRPAIPQHWNCRSIYVPKKTKTEIITARRPSIGPTKEYKQGDNKTRTGRVRKPRAKDKRFHIATVSEGITFEDWLRRQDEINPDWVKDWFGSHAAYLDWKMQPGTMQVSYITKTGDTGEALMGKFAVGSFVENRRIARMKGWDTSYFNRLVRSVYSSNIREKKRGMEDLRGAVPLDRQQAARVRMVLTNAPRSLEPADLDAWNDLALTDKLQINLMDIEAASLAEQALYQRVPRRVKDWVEESRFIKLLKKDIETVLSNSGDITDIALYKTLTDNRLWKKYIEGRLHITRTKAWRRVERSAINPILRWMAEEAKQLSYNERVKAYFDEPNMQPNLSRLILDNNYSFFKGLKESWERDAINNTPGYYDREFTYYNWIIKQPEVIRESELMGRINDPDFTIPPDFSPVRYDIELRKNADRWWFIKNGFFNGRTPDNLRQFVFYRGRSFAYPHRGIVYAYPGDREISHEIGHLIEIDDPRYYAATKAFRDRRAYRHALQPLYENLPDEKAYPGDYIDRYMGKVYPDMNTTEILSSGFERLVDPMQAQFLPDDPEYLRLILSIFYDWRGGE